MIKNNLMIVPLSHYKKWLIPFQDEKTREFIRKARLVHGDKYDYRFVKYINNSEKICIVCKLHGEFWQTPNNHLRGQNCYTCGRIAFVEKRLDSNSSFIEKANSVHNGKYDYSKVSYEKSNKKVCIICPIHGEFWQKPNSHLSGRGCPKCGREEANKKKSSNTENFILLAKLIHGNKYDYSKVNYINQKTKVTIICPIHGEFEQTPNNHLAGHPCSKCGKPRMTKSNTDEFKNKAKEIHGDKYNYDKVNYINSSTKVIITCPEHGDFEQKPNDHLMGHGCPICGYSNICESYVGDWLNDHNIENIRYFVTDLIKISGHIIIDFKAIIDQKEVWLEYNGPTHYMLVDFFHNGNIENFKNQLRRDEKVRNYCNKNNIRLIEIPYTYNTKESIFEFLDKVITKGIDPYTFIDYESLFKRPLDYESIIEN